MYNIIFVYLAVSFAPINAAVGNSFGNDPAILAFKNKVTNELKDYPNVQSRVLKIIEDVIKNVEDSTANIRENEKILKAKINNLKQNLVEKRRTIEQYVRCKSKQQEAESFHGFLKEIEGSLAFRILITFGNFPTLQNCLKEQLKISENMKSNNNEEKCNQFKTFPEEDIKDLDDLIAKKYMNIKSFNNGLFIYDFAVRNVDELISLAKRIGGFL
ncbi:unnamed protein product [Schistosoma haematobium]|nr:unnamed protein product [Schistosoma haematobium]